MKICPITLRVANGFVLKHHRHHKQTQGAKFAIGLQVADDIVGVAICGRPVSRMLDNGKTIEVTRLCLKDGIKNGCSKLYAACAKISREMGYEKIITYILESESGGSLIASGWQLEESNVGGKKWNSGGGIIRTDSVTDLFGTEIKYPSEMKKRWSKIL